MMAALLSHPMFGLVLTVAAYAVASELWQRAGHPALLHPVLLATLFVIAILHMGGIGYDVYLSGAGLLNEALGLIVILLAVPLYRHSTLIRRSGVPLALALVGGSLTALASTLALPVLEGSEPSLLATLAPRSSTAAVAVEISEHLGGMPGLTAVVVISTGIFGAVAGPPILTAAGVTDERARGFALGLASHAIGTARAFQLSDVSGAFASLGMILNAMLTTLLAPLVMTLLAS